MVLPVLLVFVSVASVLDCDRLILRVPNLFLGTA